MQMTNGFSITFCALGQTTEKKKQRDRQKITNPHYIQFELFISNHLRIDKIAEDIAAVGTVGRAQIVGS